jgi:hypothetical protein
MAARGRSSSLAPCVDDKVCLLSRSRPLKYGKSLENHPRLEHRWTAEVKEISQLRPMQPEWKEL